MPTYIHGGTDPREVARLERQALFVSPRILTGFSAQGGERILDLATGVGAMAGQLLERFPGIQVVGVDLNRAQLDFAKANHPEGKYVQADAAALPFRSRTFDRLHCSWLLEHVRSPLAVLKEARRVLKPDALCHITEVDNASFSVVPKSKVVSEIVDALNRAQQQGGGDPFIGQKLGDLFGRAGFRKVQVRTNPVVGDRSDVPFFEAFVEEWAEIFESLDEALGPSMKDSIQAAARALRELPKNPEAEIRYASVTVQALA